ncbi:MAG TPA: hypothetical protein VED01_03870, partial [Burkholderiales bacterium]|nr:hypothetical protein [Burkholderiales bacterium]
ILSWPLLFLIQGLGGCAKHLEGRHPCVLLGMDITSLYGLLGMFAAWGFAITLPLAAILGAAGAAMNSSSAR